jgi:hypothetical protein
MEDRGVLEERARQMLEAAGDGDLEWVKRLVKLHKGLVQGQATSNPLLWLADCSRPEGAAPFMAPLIAACRSGRGEVVRFLWVRGPRWMRSMVRG